MDLPRRSGRLPTATAAGPLPARTALVCYGSETGNAQEAAAELARVAERLRFSTRLCDLNAVAIVGQHSMFRLSSAMLFFDISEFSPFAFTALVATTWPNVTPTAGRG